MSETIKQFWEWILFKYYKWRGYEILFATGFARGDNIVMIFERGIGAKARREGYKVLAKQDSLVIINSKTNT